MTTNDGNAARRPFEVPSLSAAITVIGENFVTRFSMLFTAMSSGYKGDAMSFAGYAQDTVKLYIRSYP